MTDLMLVDVMLVDVADNAAVLSCLSVRVPGDFVAAAAHEEVQVGS
jgi:hypothetical protein